MRTLRFISLLLVLTLTSCAELLQLAQHTLETGTSVPLTQTDVVAGLKEALVTGTSNSAKVLSITDGYYKDSLVKILLPPEADIIVDNLKMLPGGDQLVEDILIRINRAAEDAALDVKPIFVSSITSMSLTDGFDILKGADNAATQYLRHTTYDQLSSLYRPKIAASLDKKLVGDISTAESWHTLTAKWNSIAESFVGQVTGLKIVETDLGDYLTEKALDGLFLKIEVEEKQIREDPAARVTGLLRRVFGSLDV